jgi:hypothetical protein
MYEILKRGKFHNLSISCQLDLFDKVVKPILLYSRELWGLSNCDIIERVHLQEKIAFCVLHKWYIKRYTTDQIFDCFPVISLVQYDTIRCFIEGMASQFTINHTIWS